MTDGHSEFVGPGGQRVGSPPQHDVRAVADSSDRATLLDQLRRHAAGETSYPQLSAALAASGIERWVGDTTALTMAYHDRAGTALLVQNVE